MVVAGEHALELCLLLCLLLSHNGFCLCDPVLGDLAVYNHLVADMLRLELLGKKSSEDRSMV